MGVHGGNEGGIAEGFASEGASIIVNYVKDAASAEAVVANVKALGADAIAVKADVGDEKAVPSMVDTGLKTTHVAGKVKIVGYDADPQQVSDLKTGVVEALIAQEPYLEGVDGVQQAVNAINGKPTKSILTSLAVLTKSNLAANSKFIYKSHC